MGQHRLLVGADHQERDGAARFERRVGQRDARLRPPLGDLLDPALALLEHGLAGEQRGRMAVRPQPEQGDIEERPAGIEHGAAVDALERRLVGTRRLGGRGQLGRHPGHVLGRDLDAAEQGVSHHLVVAVRVGHRHEALVAEEQHGAAPGELGLERGLGEALVERARRRAARQAQAERLPGAERHPKQPVGDLVGQHGPAVEGGDLAGTHARVCHGGLPYPVRADQRGGLTGLDAQVEPAGLGHGAQVADLGQHLG